MAENRINKNIKPFSGTNYDTTAADFIRKVERDAQAKLGTEPIRRRPGPDPDGLDPNDPHETRDWRNYATKRGAIFGMYLTGPAEQWYNTQIDGNPNYFNEWPVARAAFITRFDNDTQRGAAEIELEKAKRESHETVVDWNAKITQKVEHAFAHEAADSRLEKVRMYFKKGLQDTLRLEYNKIYLQNRGQPHIDIVQQVNTIDLATQLTSGTLGNTIETLENECHQTNGKLAHINEINDDPRKSQRFRAFCTYCKKNGHKISECRTKKHHDQNMIQNQGYRTPQPKLTFNNTFNPTNPRNSAYTRPQSGGRGNNIQNENRYPNRGMYRGNNYNNNYNNYNRRGRGYNQGYHNNQNYPLRQNYNPNNNYNQNYPNNYSNNNRNNNNYNNNPIPQRGRGQYNNVNNRNNYPKNQNYQNFENNKNNDNKNDDNEYEDDDTSYYYDTQPTSNATQDHLN